MSALQLEQKLAVRQAPNGTPVIIARSGVVTAWRIVPGQRVQVDDVIAIFDDGGGPIKLTARQSGRVTNLVKAGIPIEAGQPIAHLDPDGPPEPQQRAVNPSPTEMPHHPNGNGKSQQATNSVALALPEPLPLPIVVEPEPVVVAQNNTVEAHPEPAAKPKKKRTTLRNYSIGSHQEQALALLALKRNTRVVERGEGGRVNESELVRCAIEMLLSLPESALDAVIEQNKLRESQEKWGTGRPRPGRGKK